MNKYKINFEEAVHLRNYRKDHTRYDTASIFGISESTVTKISKETDNSLIKSYGGHVEYSEVEIVDCFLDKVKIRYKSGIYKGLFSYIKTYYLLNTDFVPSFAILTEDSKIRFITQALKDHGYHSIVVSRVGEKGLGSEYMALCDGIVS